MQRCQINHIFSGAILGVALAVLPFGPIVMPVLAADVPMSWPAEVKASYKLSFNGFNVGSFKFSSKTTGDSYVATSNTEVSALFGAYKWKGTNTATGKLKDVARPASYDMKFKGKSKVGSVKLVYDDGGVTQVTLVPSSRRSPEVIEIKPEHLVDVIDPMTAVLALSHSKSSGPCDKRLRVFDGKARFDLILSPKRKDKLDASAPGGAGTLDVCKVKYIPVAGHKPKDFDNPWVKYDGIEVSMRVVPKGGVDVPYRIVVPTTLGSAVVNAERIDITTASRQQIALKK